MDNEIWKPVPDFEGLYEVSSYGNVRGLKRGKLLKPHIQSNGYLRYNLYKDGKPYYKYAHRLVALAFMDAPTDDFEVNHKNKIVTDNRLCNLEWVTHEDNMYHAHSWRPQYQILNLFTDKWDDLI